MSRNSPEKVLGRNRKRLSSAAETGDVSEGDFEYITALLDAFDERKPTTPKPEGDRHRELRTLGQWSNRLRTMATRLDGELTDASPSEINTLLRDMAEGKPPAVKDAGLATNTMNGYSSTLRIFYGFHDLEPTKDEIATFSTEKQAVDERDMFTAEEIDRMREAVDHPRNQCIFELLIYTGQRIRALQTLRIKDIDLEDGTFHLNDEDGGLKGAKGKRPLLGAESAVREWYKYHPNSNDPEAYLLTYRQEYRSDADGSEPIGQRSINGALKKIGDRANVDKPCNAHNFRHNFVTIAKRKFDMDDSTIKALIGHDADSKVMETTYAHLTDEDHIKHAEIAVGKRDPDDEDTALSPEICPTCDEPLPEAAKACPSCGLTFTPDAKSAEDVIEDSLYEAKGEAKDESEEMAVDALRDVIKNNPELLAELIEEANQ